MSHLGQQLRVKKPNSKSYYKNQESEKRMKNIHIKLISILTIFTIVIAVIQVTTLKTDASENILVMTITATGFGASYDVHVYANDTGNGDYTFSTDKEELDFINDKSNSVVQVSVNINNSEIIEEDSIWYESEIEPENYDEYSSRDDFLFYYSVYSVLKVSF